MFGSRKHRQPNPPLATVPVNPHAATAAAAVFKRHESSSPSLSAAAAAAALAARPMTPTRVADVQTKRTIRRSASVASSRASSDAHRRPVLQRSGSSASMTERTFRSPSPHRPSSSGSGHRQSQSLGFDPLAPDAMPPVPALPKAVEPGSGRQQQGTQQGLAQRRTTVMGISNPPVRLASEKLASKDAHSWFGAAKVGDMQNVRRTDPAMASPPSSPPQTARQGQPDTARPSSRSSSINFSYPARARVASPPPGAPLTETDFVEPPPVSATQTRLASRDRRPSQPQPSRRMSAVPGPAPSAPNDTLVYDPNSRRMVRQVDLWAAEQAIVQASERRTSIKKKKQTPQRAGSHLAKGTMGRTKIGGSVFQPDQQPERMSAALPIQSQSQPRHIPAVDAEVAQISSPVAEPRAISQQRHPEPAAAAEHSAQFLATGPVAHQSTGQAVKRQPSTVREESESELESEPERETQNYATESLNAVPSRQRVFINDDPQPRQDFQAANHPPSFPAAPLSPPPSQEPHFSTAPPKQADANQENSKYAGFAPIKNLHIVPPRNHSNSPVRQAHFGPVSDSLAVRHSPPPRSISPRKSALKNSCSPSRGSSPSDDTSEISGGIRQPEEPPMTRKKSVRVSFDDANTGVAGDSAPVLQADSPSSSSPQGHREHRPWFSSLRPGKKEQPSFDDDETMKPRPALPSFGSVRDRKPREVLHEEVERPLVRPMGDRPHVPTGQTGQSSDHAIAAILAKEAEDRARVPANTSRFREPLPPVVTSVDGGDFMHESDTSSTAGSDDLSVSEAADVNGDQLLEAPLEPANGVVEGSSKPVRVESLSSVRKVPEKLAQTNQTPQDINIPTITIAQPTPPVLERKTTPPYFYLPGGFPEDDSASAASTDAKNAVPNSATVKEPVDVPLSVIAGQPMSLPVMEPSSESESSIYSDAYEDLSDIEGTTFQSLDAVVESPVSITTRGALAEEGPLQASPSRQPAKVLPPTNTASEETSPADDEWEKAKAYWRSLTAEKRAQLAKETTEDAGIEGDLEEAMTEPKPKKKKSVERRVSERKVLAVHMAQQMMAEQEKQKPVAATATSRRSYMIEPGTKWAADKAAASPTMRTTMRSQPQQQAPVASTDIPHLRNSMRSGQPSTAKSRPASQPLGQDVRTMRVASQQMPATTPRNSTAHTRAASEQTSHKEPYNPPKLKRRGSTSSESSFRRSRPVGGGLSAFRQSMRPTSPPSSARPAEPTEKGFKRFSLRSKSPPVSMNNASSQMRQTLRDSSAERKKSSPTGFRMPSFGLSSSGGSKKAGKRASGSKFSSRLGDSSDEEGDGGRSGFRSRFEDSSDDEVVSPISLPPPKKSPTIPGHLRHQESVASTALPEELEESEEMPPNVKATASVPAAAVLPPQQPALAPPVSSGPAAPSPLGATTTTVKAAAEHKHSRRGSLMSALRRKKQPPAIARPEVTESAARRDTKLERPASQLRSPIPEAETTDDDGNPAPLPASSPSRSPKLQKRVASLRRSLDSANLTNANVTGGEIPSPGSEQQPSPFDARGGGDGALRSPLRRPSATVSGNLGTRTLSGFSVAAGGDASRPPPPARSRTVGSGQALDAQQPEAESLAGTGSTRKKKFGALRRLLGIHD